MKAKWLQKIPFKKIWSWTKVTATLLFQIALLSIILFRVLPVPFTPLMVMRFGSINHQWVPYNQINKNMVIAAMTCEDPNFNNHWGFDTKAIEKAIENNLDDDGKPLKGGSTISQQTAKNVFLFYGDLANAGPIRYIRKGLEIPFTLAIEAMWTKRRIMEVYLNVIEMGPGIYGIEAASQYYYGKPAAKLTAKESASIAVCFPLPLKRNPLKLKPKLQRRRDSRVRWMAGYELPENLRE